MLLMAAENAESAELARNAARTRLIAVQFKFMIFNL